MCCPLSNNLAELTLFLRSLTSGFGSWGFDRGLTRLWVLGRENVEVSYERAKAGKLFRYGPKGPVTSGGTSLDSNSQTSSTTRIAHSFFHHAPLRTRTWPSLPLRRASQHNCCLCYADNTDFRQILDDWNIPCLLYDGRLQTLSWDTP